MFNISLDLQPRDDVCDPAVEETLIRKLKEQDPPLMGTPRVERTFTLASKDAKGVKGVGVRLQPNGGSGGVGLNRSVAAEVGKPTSLVVAAAEVGIAGPTRFDLTISPPGNNRNSTPDTDIIVLDPRPSPPDARLYASAATGVPGRVALYLVFPTGAQSFGVTSGAVKAFVYDTSRSPEFFAVDAGSFSRLNDVSLLPPALVPAGGEVYTGNWDSSKDYSNASADVSLALVVDDGGKVFGSVVELARRLESTGSCLRVDNTVPEVLSQSVNIESIPEGSTVRQGLVTVFGAAKITYNVRDAGEEPCDLRLSATLSIGARRRNLALNCRDCPRDSLPISPLFGAVELTTGIAGLATSGDETGRPHSFAWNVIRDAEEFVASGVGEGAIDPVSPVQCSVRISVVDSISGRASTTQDRSFIVQLSAVQTVLGTTPEFLRLGQTGVRAKEWSVSNIAAVATERGQRQNLYVCDERGNAVWVTPLTDTITPDSRLDRLVGGRFVRPAFETPQYASDALLDARIRLPRDVIVDDDASRLYLLEGSGVLSRVDLASGLIDTLLTAGVLNSPRQAALELDGSRRFLYIADTNNCRILRVDLDRVAPGAAPDSHTRILLGGVTGAVDVGQALADKIYVEPGTGAEVVFPELNDCNYIEGPPVDLKPEDRREPCAPIYASSPWGVASWKGPSGRRYLLVTYPQNSTGTLRAIDLGMITDADSLGELERIRTTQPVKLCNEGEDCASLPGLSGRFGLCLPKRLHVVDDFLYVASDGVRVTGGVSRGIVVRFLLEEGPGGVRVRDLELVAGNVSSVNGTPVDCGCAESQSPSNLTEPDACIAGDALRFGNPTGVIADPQGRILVSDSENKKVRVVDSCEGRPAPSLVDVYLDGLSLARDETLTFVGLETRPPPGAECAATVLNQGAAATTVVLSNPRGLAFLDDSNLLVCDSNKFRLLALDLRTGVASAVVGQVARAATAGVCEQSVEEGRPARDLETGRISDVAVFPPRRPRAAGQRCPAAERLYVADQQRNLVFELNTRTGATRAAAGMTFPTVAVRLSNGNRCVRLYSTLVNEIPNSELVRGGDARRVYVKGPRGLAVDSRGRVLICEARGRITSLSGGQLRRVAGRGVAYNVPPTITVGNRDVLTADLEAKFQSDIASEEEVMAYEAAFAERVTAAELRGPAQDVVGVDARDGAANALDIELFGPGDLVLDSEEEYAYLAEWGNHRILRLKYDVEDGSFSEVRWIAGTGEAKDTFFRSYAQSVGRAKKVGVFRPYGIDLDEVNRSDGSPLLYYSTEKGNAVYRVKLVDSTGDYLVESVTGDLSAGLFGDGDDPAKAQWIDPAGVLLDGVGGLYVSDQGSNRVRRLLPPPSFGADKPVKN